MEESKYRKNRGVLTPFIQYITNLTHGACTIYAGTSISVSTGDTIQSDIGKIGLTTVETELPFLDMKDVRQRLDSWLDLSEIPNIDAVLTEYVTGRCRFVSMLPHHISTALQIDSDMQKEDILQDAVDDMINNVTQKLTSRLSASLKSRMPDETKLRELYLGIKFANGIVEVPFDDDLVNVGIASLGKTGSMLTSRIREPLSMKIYLQTYEKIFGKNIYLDILNLEIGRSKNQSTKGAPFESVCAGLISNFQKYQTVSKFLTSLFPKLKDHEEKIPNWTKTCKLSIDTIGNFEGLSNVKVIKDMN